MLITDCRVKNQGKKLKELMSLTRNGSYKMYINSTKESRGVAIAIKNNLHHEIIREYKDEANENYYILRIKIQGNLMGLGVIYGPNYNDREYYRNIINIYNEMLDDGLPVILGGDFNTILDRDITVNNKDMVNRVGSIPNNHNSKVLVDWIAEGRIVDAFRFTYPDRREISYIPFRQRAIQNNEGNLEHLGSKYSRARLDMILISTDLLQSVNGIRYEDRLGRDFDHKEVVLELGGGKKTASTNIKTDTLKEDSSTIIGKISFYDMINEHLIEPLDIVRDRVGRLEQLFREKYTRGNDTIIDEGPRIGEIDREMEGILRELPTEREMLDLPSNCDDRVKYEVVIMSIKNRLTGLQADMRKVRIKKRVELQVAVNEAKLGEGEGSIEYQNAVENLLAYNDEQLKLNTGRFREFFSKNNEKPTAAFCKLGKTPNSEDDLCTIRGHSK